MIGHVYDNLRHCNEINYLVVATPDQKIKKFINSINGNSIMTKSSHKRATDRTAEAVNKLEKKLMKKFDLIIMVQGDEPMVNQNMINKTILEFKKNKKVNITNLISKINTKKDFENHNTIKVVFDKKFNSLRR